MPWHWRQGLRTSALAAMLFSAAGLAGGCRPHPQARKSYYGPTLPMYDVIQKINANNARLPTLWMEHDFEADLVDRDSQKRTHVSGEGTILYRAPQDLLFTGSKLGFGEIFQIGSNDQRYWLRIPYKDVSTMWWGRYEHLGKPCVEPMPIRPDLILEVLGVLAIPPDFTQLPAPVMRFNHDRDVYMITWVTRAPDRYVALKEVWYDRSTLLPVNVLLFDADGRVVLRAYLSHHEPVEVQGIPKESRPRIASEYDMFFPESGSKLSIHITRALKEYRRGRAVAPNDAAFQFPEPPGVAKVIQLDEGCGD